MSDLILLLGRGIEWKDEYGIAPSKYKQFEDNVRLIEEAVCLRALAEYDAEHIVFGSGGYFCPIAKLDFAAMLLENEGWLNYVQECVELRKKQLAGEIK